MKVAMNTLVAAGLFFGLVGQVHAAAKDVTCPTSFRSANPRGPDVRIIDLFQHPAGRPISEGSSEPVMPRLSIPTPIHSDADLLKLNAGDWDKMIELDEVFQSSVAKYYRDDTIFQRYVDSDHARILEVYQCFRDRAAIVTSGGGGKAASNSSSSRGGVVANTNTNTSTSTSTSTGASTSVNSRTPKKNYQIDPAYKAAAAKQCPWNYEYKGVSYLVTNFFPNLEAGHVIHLKYGRFVMPQLSINTPITSHEQLNQLTSQDWEKLEKAFKDLTLAMASPEEARKMDSPERKEIFSCYTGRAQAMEGVKYGSGGSSQGGVSDSGRASYLSGKCVKFSNAGSGVSDDYKRISNLCNKKIAVAYCEYLGSDSQRCNTKSEEAWSVSSTVRVGGSTMFSARFGLSRNQRVTYYVCDMTNASKMCLPPSDMGSSDVNDGSLGN